MSTLDNPILEEGNAQAGPIALRFGAIGGMVMIALGLVLQLTGLVDPANPQNSTNWLGNVLNIAVTVGVIVYAIKAFMADNGGFVTFGRGFTVGALTVLVMVVISVIWTYVYFAVIEPDLVDTIREVTKDNMIEKQGMDPDQAEKTMGAIGWMFSPGMMAGWVAIFGVIFGMIISLITAAIMKKNAAGNDLTSFEGTSFLFKNSKGSRSYLIEKSG